MSTLAPIVPFYEPTQLACDAICETLAKHSFVVQKDFFSPDLIRALHQEASSEQTRDEYRSAGIGRNDNFQLNASIRKDKIRWLNGETPAQREYQQVMETLRHTLNQTLLLALFEYEYHFAHYRPGAFYKKHVDSFQHTRSRLVTTVTYLNPEWSTGAGGELRAYEPSNHDAILSDVAPEAGTLVVFLSEDIPHEVLTTRQDRYSIAGWYRMRALNSAFPAC